MILLCWYKRYSISLVLFFSLFEWSARLPVLLAQIKAGLLFVLTILDVWLTDVCLELKFWFLFLLYHLLLVEWVLYQVIFCLHFLKTIPRSCILGRKLLDLFLKAIFLFLSCLNLLNWFVYISSSASFNLKAVSNTDFLSSMYFPWSLVSFIQFHHEITLI